MTVIDKLKEASAFLKSKGIEDAHKESEIIAIHSLNIDKTALYRDNPILSEKNIKEIDDILERRAKREPLQYILGYVEFYGLKIRVGEGVLIPRPETELLAEEVITTIRNQKLPPHPPLVKGGLRGDENSELRTLNSKLKVLDLCTGSGCLALALAKNLPDSTVYGTDISAHAIRYAKENAEINGIRNVTFLKGSLFEPLSQLLTHNSSLLTFDVIVSNPPYIKSNDIPDLQPEIKDWEPRNALDGGADGLRYYKEILSRARHYLTPPSEKNGGGGFFFLEIGEGQADAVIMMAVRAGYRDITIIKDYSGIERIVSMTC